MSLLDKDLETLQAGSNYKFSATKIGSLGAEKYTLATIVEDASGSVAAFATLLEQAIKSVYKAMLKSPQKENLMLRLTQFSDDLKELHGFKLLDTIKESDYDNILQIGGNTALFDAVDEAIQVTSTYGKQLISQNFYCNGIIVVITDGQNNQGALRDPAQIKRSLLEAQKAENLESLMLILVGVTNGNISLDAYLMDFVNGAGITQYVSISEATPGKLAKFAAFVSQSVSSTSTALGTGAPSKPITSFTF